MDNRAIHGPSSRVAPCFKELCCVGPMFGYYPEVKKLIATCPLGNQSRLKAMFLVADLKIK